MVDIRTVTGPATAGADAEFQRPFASAGIALERPGQGHKGQV